MKVEILPSPFKWDTLHQSICLTGTSPRKKKENNLAERQSVSLTLDITANKTSLLVPLKLKADLVVISVVAEILIKWMKIEVSMKIG